MTTRVTAIATVACYFYIAEAEEHGQIVWQEKLQKALLGTWRFKTLTGLDEFHLLVQELRLDAHEFSRHFRVWVEQFDYLR